MPRPPCSPRPPAPTPVVPSTVLDDLARHLALSHLDADHATLVRARPDTTGVDLALCALPPGTHPADALVGHTVPRRWAASGVVAAGRARHLDRPDDPGAPVSVAVLVGRDGHVAHHMAPGPDRDDAGPARRGSSDAAPDVRPGAPLPDLDEAPLGRLPDLLHRTLGLPTDPPTGPAAVWWRALWLDAVVAAAATDPRRTPDPATPLTDVLPPDLVEALVADPVLCGPDGWARLHDLASRAAPSGDPGEAAVRRAVAPYADPTMAAWMDVGCFARWLCAALPAIDDLLHLAAALVPSETLAALRHAAGGPCARGRSAP